MGVCCGTIETFQTTHLATPFIVHITPAHAFCSLRFKKRKQLPVPGGRFLEFRVQMFLSCWQSLLSQMHLVSSPPCRAPMPPPPHTLRSVSPPMVAPPTVLTLRFCTVARRHALAPKSSLEDKGKIKSEGPPGRTWIVVSGELIPSVRHSGLLGCSPCPQRL